jgi:hypothetical protein
VTTVSTAIPTRVVHLGRARRLHGDLIDRLLPFLYRQDPPADEVVQAFAREPVGWAGLDRALREGPAPGDPPELHRLVEQAADVPPWVDWTRIARAGRVFFRSGIAGGITLGAKSLVHGYCSPGGNKPLAFSGRLYQDVPKRLAETGRFVQAVNEPDGMRPHHPGWAATLRVRLMHAEVRRLIHDSGKWRPEHWGAPINQHDMVATTLLFSKSFIDGVRTFGGRVDPDEADDVLHLWRWVGHVIGVDDGLLPTSEQEATRLADVIDVTQGPPDDDARKLVHALLTPPEQSLSRAERALARLRRPLSYGLCRGLIGDELADALQLPRTPMRNVPAVVAGAWKLTAPVRHAIDEERFVRFGEGYWRRAVEQGMGGAAVRFAPPARLMGRSAA